MTRSAACSPIGLVVQRRVTAGARLELVEEVVHDLGQRQRVAHLHAVLGQVVHAQQRPAPVLAQLHDRPDELAGGQDRRSDDGLVDLRDLPAGELAGVGHGVLGAGPPSTTRYTTFGAVEIRSRSNSRSRRSRTISKCSSPRNPHRNPNPSAAEVSGS